MALGTTNISLNAVRTAIGEASYSLFTIGTSALINKWSRYKPIRDAGAGANRPAGSNSKYGLNLPTNWDYLHPQGGSPGGGTDEPVRLGDFRGYEHDKDAAGPVIWCTSANAVVPASITPNITGVGCAATFVANMNTAHESLRILLSDLGYGSYYWGVKVGSYYKTFGTVANGTNMSFDLTLNMTDPMNPTFVGFPTPVIMAAGTITWRLFISSTERTSWNSSAPSNVIELPGSTGETYGSKTIVSTGTFTLTDFIGIHPTSAGWNWDSTTKVNIYVSQSAAKWHIHEVVGSFSVQSSDGGIITPETSEFDRGDYFKVFPTGNNNSYTGLIGSVFVHDSNHNEVEVELLQGAHPAPVPVGVSLSEANANFEAKEFSGSVAVPGTTTITLDLVINCLAGTSLGYTITHNSNPAGSGNITVLNDTFCQRDIACSYSISSGDTVNVVLDAVTA